jgi:hypothetical protein
VTYHQENKNSPPESGAIDAELLQEALADRQRENREALEALFKRPGRFRKNELGYSFRLTDGEIEWLLQVLNDIRVGTWVKLGSPGPTNGRGWEITEENVELAWTMEMAGHFQAALLEAIQSSF